MTATDFALRQKTQREACTERLKNAYHAAVLAVIKEHPIVKEAMAVAETSGAGERGAAKLRSRLASMTVGQGGANLALIRRILERLSTLVGGHMREMAEKGVAELVALVEVCIV
jgi:hypothetical protein